MGQRITPEELHALVWAEPMRKLAERFGISDVALKKQCCRMHVPVPPRGHWARKTAGKSTIGAALPPRPPGLNDETTIGGGRYWPYHSRPSTEELLDPPPPEPSFEEPIEEVQRRVEAAIGKVAVPKDLDNPHPVVAKLLRQDEDRRQKQRGFPYASSLYATLYDSPIQRRRLRLLSAILLAAARCGCKADTWGAAPFGEPVTQFAVRVHGQNVCLQVAVDETKRRSGKGARARATTRQVLKVELCPATDGRSAVRVWQDGHPAAARPHKRRARAVPAATAAAPRPTPDPGTRSASCRTSERVPTLRFEGTTRSAARARRPTRIPHGAVRTLATCRKPMAIVSSVHSPFRPRTRLGQSTIPLVPGVE